MRKFIIVLIVFINVMIFSHNLSMKNKIYIDPIKVDLDKYIGTNNGQIFLIKDIDNLNIERYNIYNEEVTNFFEFFKNFSLPVLVKSNPFSKQPYYTEFLKVINDKIYIIDQIGEKRNLYIFSPKNNEEKTIKIKGEIRYTSFISFDARDNDIFLINEEGYLYYYNINNGVSKKGNGFPNKNKIMIVNNNVYVIVYDTTFKYPHISIIKYDFDLNIKNFSNREYSVIETQFDFISENEEREIYSSFIEDYIKITKFKNYIIIMDEKNFYIIDTRTDEKGYSKLFKKIPIKEVIDKKVGSINKLILDADEKNIYLINKENYILYVLSLNI
ncbi:hypothetical protein X275_04455 [Marinitoga sp. 1197]|uniref:hypothetical protein n=1 Tax=Marinitoga sp. 1197 TaxID=1428449 RepID=UPI00064139D3|nr:hypothetical protein [Marinitoga sp. 1197]KLO22836.1 hypothetical protein X275_04455 [Marinitoga sp. 1197]